MDNIMRELSNFAKSWCNVENHRRNAEEAIRSAEHAIVWCENRIKELSLLLEKRPSVIKEIKNLQHQILEHQVKIAFNPYYQTDLKKLQEWNDKEIFWQEMER